MKNIFTWDFFLKSICAITAIIILAAIVCKLFIVTTNIAQESLKKISIESLFMLLVAAILLPRLNQLEAFGVKMALKEKVENLSAKMQAIPDYVLGSEYEEEEDYLLAEQSYRWSLAQSSDFWPAILGLASIFHDQEQYDRAIMEYNRVLSLDSSNIYVFNNLADVYLKAPPPIGNVQKALEMANRALEIIPSYGSALYYKAEALNKIGSYTEARDIFSDIIENGRLPKQQHWVMYELLISKSNLGSLVSSEDLGKILSQSLDKGTEEGRDFLEVLADEKELARFRQEDIATICKFIKENSNIS